ncbi:SymE family type I addiction module toxin [Flavivirga eckloniae]|uniref:Toxin SymE-like domain-containing protein n=1 Tax=Flavivirga eckloniae TaxID=1803846 RepID=A0A2K9PKR2_9FLAO|nr:SymE family type I addiction module toxin [Flavivirga eckloniae]AUP77659.1 hypothetical protein C1H87_02585 [Flavivirga eckloniae]
MSKFRILKIYSKFRYRRWSNNYTVPEIRLEGRWLEQLGFEKGKEVLIEQKKNKLIITMRKEKEHNKVYKK